MGFLLGTTVRTVIVTKGFEYSLVPIPKDEKIYLGPAKGPEIVF